MSPDANPKIPDKTGISGEAVAVSVAVEPKKVHADPDLQAIIDAWPALPEPLKAGILAMVKTATTRHRLTGTVENEGRQAGHVCGHCR